MSSEILEIAGLAHLCDDRDIFYRAVGCGQCRGSGYQGRTGIHELLVLNEPIRQAILEGQDSGALSRLASRHGMRTLHEEGLRKVIAGVTTLDELGRVTQEQSDG